MNKNQIVNVYQKPITSEDYEGRARLIEEIRPDQDGLSTWSVEFLDEPGTFYPRTINAENAQAQP